jgi:DNA-binding winged helix-turn-helix (wHTH) protein/tetratricopeptide (TPR) repeat protein
MAAEPNIQYEFGPFRVDPDKQTLLRDNQPVPITSKAFETLLILLRNNREVVSKENLMQALWPDTVVEESNLSQNIFMLRKVLGDTPEERRYILTLPGRGYRFVSEVRVVTQASNTLMFASRTRSQVEIQQTDEERVIIEKALPAAAQMQSRGKKYATIVSLIVLLAMITSAITLWRRSNVLSEKDLVLIADFSNSTGDQVFDDALREGLIVQLEQSPFLNLVPEDRVRSTLQLMGQPADSKVTPALTRQICERTSAAAVLDGSIATVGTQYLIALQATNCQNGGVLAEEQVQADRKEDVLGALTQIAVKFRRHVGESLATIQQHDTPLADATTPSLDALKAYSAGWKMILSKGDTAALPFFQRAIELDPQFAMAYASMGRAYGDLGEAALSAESTAKAYGLRSRASDAEKFWITTAYQTQVTENLEQAHKTCMVWEQTYPRDRMPHAFVAGVIDPVLGRYEEAAQEAKTAIEIDPDFAIAYFLLAWRNQELGRYQQAEDAIQQASTRKLQLPDFIIAKYKLAFLRGDGEEMERALISADQNPANEWLANSESSVLSYSGRLQQSIQAATRASSIAQQAGHREAAALYLAATALAAGFVQDHRRATQFADAALKLSDDRGVEYGAALALALAGESSLPQQLAQDLAQRYPEDISVQFSYVPVLQAQIAINRGQPAEALNLLEKAAPYELGEPRTALHANFGAMYPVYVRGEAYLAEHHAAEAVFEFRKIVDHSGITVGDPIGALADLQVGRAYALSGENSKAKSFYEAFFKLWKAADPDLSVLKQAKTEYAKL